MKNPNINRIHFLSVGYFIFKFLLLNLITLGTTFFLLILRNAFEQTEILIIRFPIEMFGIAFVLSNFIYVIGNLLEFVHTRFWNKPFIFKDNERRMFKMGIIMIAIVHSAGVIIYLINF